MKKRRYFGLDIGSRYEITAKNLLVYEAFGNRELSIPLSNATFKRERRGVMGWLFDFGDVVVLNQGVEVHRCTSLSGCSTFQSALQNAATLNHTTGIAAPEAKTEVNAHHGIPAGKIFSDKVLLVPAISTAFSHSGNVSDRRKELQYMWVRRGETIGKFTISLPRTGGGLLNSLRGEMVYEIDIPCPVSGLVVHGIYDFKLDMHENWDNANQGYGFVRMAILLTEDEPPAEKSSFMFSRLCDFLWDKRAIYLEESRYWSKPGYKESRFRELVDEQLTLVPHIVDAMPKYDSYFKEARYTRPTLKPHLEKFV